MHSLGRAVTLGVAVNLGVVLGLGVASLSAQGADPRIGTWKLNVAKSKFDPGPPPQSLIVKVEPSGNGEKVSTEGPWFSGPLRGRVRGGCHHSLSVFPRAETLESPVRMVFIVVPPKRVDLLLRVVDGCEPMDVQTLLAEAPVE
jgi:hypothetical protein